MDDPNVTNHVKADLFRKAILAHRKYTDEVSLVSSFNLRR